MFCRKCGKLNNDINKFCTNCGEKFETISIEENSSVVETIKEIETPNETLSIESIAPKDDVIEEIKPITVNSDLDTIIDEYTCPNCGEKVDKDNDFCIYCGKKVNKEKSNTYIKCQVCGKLNSSVNVFCVKCGSIIGKPQVNNKKKSYLILSIISAGLTLLNILNFIAYGLPSVLFIPAFVCGIIGLVLTIKNAKQDNKNGKKVSLILSIISLVILFIIIILSILNIIDLVYDIINDIIDNGIPNYDMFKLIRILIK